MGRLHAVLAVIFLVACIGYLLAVYYLGLETEVMRDRFWLNAEPIFRGEVPTTEYPPLALIFIAIPRLFSDTPFGYNVAYVAEMYLFMVAGMLLVSRAARDLGRDRRKAVLVYSVLVLLMLEFVLDRFDIIPAVMMIGALCLFAEGRRGWAFALLAVGTLTKVYPALMFPVLIIYLLAGRRWADAAKGAAAFVGVGVVATAACWLIDPDLATGFLSYQDGRPLQIESLASSLVYLLSMFGLTDVWIQGAGEVGSFLSDNLRGDLPDAVAALMTEVAVVALVAFCVFYLWMAVKGGGGSPRLAALASLACIMVFLATDKVLSTQYLIWLIPSLVAVCILSDDGSDRGLFWCAVAVFVVSQLEFAYNVGYLGGGAAIDDLGMIVVLIRNLMLVGMLVLTLRSMVSEWRARREPEPEPQVGIVRISRHG